MKPKRDAEAGQDDSAKSLGLLYTGYLDKQNPTNGSYHVRFVVLTHDVLHWFKRSNDGQELFGEERGHVGLDSLLTVRVIDEDSTCFEVQSTNNSKRYFRGSSPLVCEEWVSAIRSAHKGFIEKDTRAAENHEISAEVLVNLVTVKSKLAGTELVISRNPAWDRIISIPTLRDGDSLLLTTTNGGTVSLSYGTIAMKCEDGMDFEVSVQSVPLDACLRISFSKVNTMSEKYDSIGAGAFVDSTVMSLLSMISKVAALERNLLTLALSSMVLIVSLLSVPYYSPDTSLLFIFSSLLSFHNISRLFLEVYKVSASQDPSSGLLVSMILHGHTFLSPDATITHDDEIPQRFIDGCEGDLKEARRRWDITRCWREAEGVNTVLETKQPYFTHIKSLYPFYHAGRGKEGHIVFYERPGDLEVAQLAARGIATEDLLRHWIFVTEYQWKILAKGDETAKGIAIIDVGTVRMGDLAGDNLDYVKKTIGYANAHYPERSHVIYLVNAPMWFSILWRIVRPLVHPNTQAKVRILTRSDTLAGLQEHIDISNIPEFYGGKLDFGGKDSCRFHSPEVVDMANFVLRVNEGSAEVKSQFDEHAVNASPTPPGKPGELFTPHVGSGSGSSIAHSYSSESFLPDSRNQAVIELNKISGKTPSSPSPLPSPSSSSLRRRKDGGFGDSHGGVYEL